MREYREERFDESCISNYSNSKRQEIEAVIKEYKENGGALKVFIRNEAYWRNGTKDSTMFALCTLDESKDHSEFWKFVENWSK